MGETAKAAKEEDSALYFSSESLSSRSPHSPLARDSAGGGGGGGGGNRATAEPGRGALRARARESKNRKGRKNASYEGTRDVGLAAYNGNPLKRKC